MKKLRKLSVLWVLTLVILTMAGASLTAYADDTPSESSAVTSSQTAEKKPKKERNLGKGIAIGLGVGVVGTGISVFLVWRSYKTNGQSEPYLYTKKAPLDLSESRDTLIDTIIDKTKIEKQNN